MTDDPLEPKPVKKRPANVNLRADVKSRPGRPPKAQSAESRFVGYLVLGFGVIAVAAVLIIALGNRSDTSPSGSNQTASGVATDYVPQRLQNPPPAEPTPLNNKAAGDLMQNLSDKIRGPKKPEIKRELNFDRQPDLAPTAIEGSWQGIIGRYTAALKMTGGTYQIVLADPNNYGNRFYSAGTYSVTEDIIQLKPRDDWPYPAAPAGSGITYQDVTRASFPVIAAILQGKMLWQNPPQSETRVLVPYDMPLIMGEPQDYIVWQRL